jgi:hypothetical protein
MRRSIHAVLVTPMSGPLARFGACGAEALRLWADLAGAALEVVDAYPSASRAVALAEARRPDVLFGPYGTGPAVAAARAGAGVLWNHGGATARLTRPDFARVVNVPSPAGDYLATVLDAMVADGVPAGSEVVLLHAGTGFGREVAAGAVTAAVRLGLDLRTVAFPPGGGPAALRRAPPGGVLLCAGSFDDDAAVASLALRRRWKAVGLVAAGVDELAEALGERVEGLYGPCQWLPGADPEPAEGPDAGWFLARYREATGRPPPYPAAAAFAAGILWQSCARDAGSAEPGSVLAVARSLDSSTLFGRFRLDPATGAQAGHRVQAVRWQRGRRVAAGG